MGSPGPTVLAVDDKQTNLEVLGAILKSGGYEVATAADGEEAWEVLQRRGQDFQAILLDRIMPNMSGLEVLEKIKAHPTLHAIPVIMQTSADATHEVLEGIQAGAYYYLTKPYQKKILLGIVQAALKDLRINDLFKKRFGKMLEHGVFSNLGSFGFARCLRLGSWGLCWPTDVQIQSESCLV